MHGISSERGRAFTLVETLVVIGILVVLGALVLPITKSIGSLRDDVKCLSNLRQIGLGIQTYAVDNDGRLPGPLLSGQYPFINSLPSYGRYSQLANVLKDYLDGQRVESETLRGTVFLCPAFKRAVENYPYSVGYGINIQQKMDGTLDPRQPFGYANNLDPATFGTMNNLDPMRLADLARLTDESGKPAMTSTWLLRDSDSKDERFKGLKIVSDPTSAAKPVHGRWRNALFADFHVERMAIP